MSSRAITISHDGFEKDRIYPILPMVNRITFLLKKQDFIPFHDHQEIL